MSAEPGLDIRWPIGLLFAVIGIALAVYGAFASHPGERLRLGINLDFWWGLVMLVFGLGMLWGAYRARRRQA